MTMDLEQAGLRLDIEDRPADADVEVLPNWLEAFNECRWPGHQKWRPLAVFARDRESIIAGLAGETYSGWLFIEYFWVSDALRGRRIGRALIGAAEGSLSTAAIRPGSTPSASRPPASIASSATRRSASSSLRRTSSASSFKEAEAGGVIFRGAKGEISRARV